MSYNLSYNFEDQYSGTYQPSITVGVYKENVTEEEFLTAVNELISASHLSTKTLVWSS